VDSNQILYVSHGNLMEYLVENEVSENSDFDSIKVEQGQMARFIQLLPKNQLKTLTNVRCNQYSASRIIILDSSYLRNILQKDQEKQSKLWKLLSSQIIEMHK